MNIIFRVDASIQIGSGHVMRCLTLANQLRREKANVAFICRELPGHLCDFIKEKDFQVFRLPDMEPFTVDHRKNTHEHWLGTQWEIDAKQTKAVLLSQKIRFKWLIVDHYALDSRWEKQIRGCVEKIMVIDDLADRSHECDLLLDQNFYHHMNIRYNKLVPYDCKKFLGPQFALLRPEFKKAVNKIVRDGKIRRILIFFGGSDPTNQTAKALEAILLLNRQDIEIDVVVGKANPRKENIKNLCKIVTNANYKCQIDNMAELMTRADLMIGAGGSTTWERCYLGLPSITLVIADNQLEVTRTLAHIGATWDAGYGENVTTKDLVHILQKALNNPHEIKEMGIKAMKFMGRLSSRREDLLLKAIMEG
jgi:UDP-2,4-diacetamido-2,4,6-trideoxy-beta-L-altropyranose hydrolase